MGGDSQQTKQAEKSREAAFRASQEARGNQAALSSDPLFEQLTALAQGIVADPLTFGPEQRRNLFNAQAVDAVQSTNQFVDQRLAQLAGPQGPGVRSGATNSTIADAGFQLGAALAQANRNVEIQGAQQDRADTIQAIQTGFQPLEFLNLLSQQISSSELGTAGTIAQSAAGANSQSPAAGIGGGLLGAGANLGSAALLAPTKGGK